MNRIKVGVALSGGVDSTSTALLLKDNYTVTGFFMQLAQPDIAKQIDRVTEVAEQLAIPLKIINLENEFARAVLDYFSSSYQIGLTPNPCIVCNKEIKFGLFLDTILGSGMDMMATGHYARIEKLTGVCHLLKGVDQSKDQSYFLSRLTQSQLTALLLPLGGRCKNDIYDFVEKHGFNTFRGSESQDVCFLENMSVADYLKNHITSLPGDIVDKQGNILGTHNGICNYTIGQRRGLGISDSSPYYVINIDARENRVIIGKNNDLYRDDIVLHNLHWISGTPPADTKCFQVKIRSSHEGCEADLVALGNGRYRLLLAQAQRAVTPGQFAVLYRDDEVIGSGEMIDQKKDAYNTVT